MAGVFSIFLSKDWGVSSDEAFSLSFTRFQVTLTEFGETPSVAAILWVESPILASIRKRSSEVVILGCRVRIFMVNSG